MTTVPITSETKRSTCRRCGKLIYLVPVPKSKSAYRWIVGNRPSNWHCGKDPFFPVRTHEPGEVIG
jgi:hypothetical protein